MRYNRFVKSALSLVLVFALIISTFTMASAKTVAELEKEKQNIAADKNKVSNDLKDVREEKADEQKIFDELEGKMKKIESEMMDLTSEIDSYNQKIEVCQGEINALDAKIKESERQIIASQKVIKAKEDEFDEIFEVLKKRMRALYIAGDASALEILLTASDISDFLNRFELVQNVAEHDAELMRRVREIVTGLQAEKANLLDIKSRQETQKATQVAAKEKLNADKAVVEEKMSAKQEKQDEYQALINESNERMKEIKGRESELIKKEQQYAAQEDAIDSQIRDIINSNGSSSSGGGSSNGKVRFIWPVQGCSTYISSPYDYALGYNSSRYRYCRRQYLRQTGCCRCKRNSYSCPVYNNRLRQICYC